MKIHIVKKGDSLYELAQKYHVELDKLIASNPHIVNPDELAVGTKVKIPAAPQPMAPAEGTYTFKHVVKQGDTLWKLSKAWDVPLADMIAANPQLKNPNVLLTGEIVYIPKMAPGAVQPTVALDSAAAPAVPSPMPDAAMPSWDAVMPGAHAGYPAEWHGMHAGYPAEWHGMHAGYPAEWHGMHAGYPAEWHGMHAGYPAEWHGMHAGYPAEWHGMHAGWPSEAPGLKAGYAPEPQEAPGAQGGYPQQSPAGPAGSGEEPWSYGSQMPQMAQAPQAPLLTEPFAGVQHWEQQAAHPFAQANVPAMEAFAAAQPELPHVPQQPFEPYMSPYGSYPYMAAPQMPYMPSFETPQPSYPYAGIHDCCAGPQLDAALSYGYGHGPSALPYAAPLSAPFMPAPPMAPMHGGAAPAAIDPSQAYTTGWPGAGPYAMPHPTHPAMGHPFAHPLGYPTHPMHLAPYEPYAAIPTYPHDMQPSAAWEGVKVDEKEEEIDLTVDEGKAGAVKTKSVSAAAASGKKTRPQSAREQLDEYLRAIRRQAPARYEHRPNLPWINV